MLTLIKGKIAESFVGRVAKDPNMATNALGLAASALVAEHVNYGKLLSGDATEIGNAAGAVVAFLVCYYIGKTKK